MPAHRLSMHKIRDVLRMHFQLQLSHRQIARALSLSHAGVSRATTIPQSGYEYSPPQGHEYSSVGPRVFPTSFPE